MNDIIARAPEIIDIELSEEWQGIHPKRGDHIRVQRSGLYSHHGIYIADDEVIHFTGADDDSILDWSKCEVIRTDLEQFLRGGIVEVKIYNEDELNDLYPVEHIVDYARACLGDKGYNLVFNNCEHFANVCTLGRFRSRQVERVLSGKLPLEEDKGMGFFGKIGGFFKGLFGGGSSGGSRSTSSTTYEPDKVKVAQIEADTKIRLACMENDRIELMKQARLDILQCETESQIALEEAKARGLAVVAQAIIAVQDKLHEVAEKRLLIIEKGSLPVIKEIENFYSELEVKIQEDNNKYTMEKLPEMISLLEKYDEGTAAHDLFRKRIDDDMALQVKHYIMQIEAVKNRQEQILAGFIASKNRIIEQTGQISAGLIDAVQKQALLGMSVSRNIEPDTKALPKADRLSLPEKAE